jgi:CRP/FNR family transcriptional regulator, dissimilatory nitrate respiration regulator
VIELLAGIPLFQGLEPAALERIAARCVVRKHPPRRMLFRKGDPCPGLFIVISGRVRIYRADPSGREQTLHEQGPGQALAEVPLCDGGPCPAHARVEEPSEFLFLSRADFEALYRSEAAIAHAIIRELGRRLRGAVGLIEKISLRDVPSRVGLTLLERAERAGGGDRSLPFVLGERQGELAERLATSRESVARAFRTLREAGLLRQQGERLEIPDPNALELWCWERGRKG